MRAGNPGFVAINNRKVKVQQWRLHGDRILFTTLVHGDQVGTDLLEQLREESVIITWGDDDAATVRPEVTHHRVAGSGPKTVHRIEVTLWLSTATPPESAVPSIEARLDQILREVQLIRAEVAELKSQRRPSPDAIASPLTTGQTLLDFEIETDESE